MVAALAVTLLICHVGAEVTGDVVRRLADGVDPADIAAAEAAPGSLPGIIHAHARRAGPAGRSASRSRAGWIRL